MENGRVTETVRVGIIGVGTMGKQYAQWICAGEVRGMSLTAAVSRNPETRSWLSKIGGPGLKVYDSEETFFSEADRFDALLIVTPHKEHPRLAFRAFSLGKHVLCDKPAGIRAVDACEMTKEAQKAGVAYGLIFHNRLRPGYQRMKELLEREELGQLKRFAFTSTINFRTEHYHKSGNWRSSWGGEGGGALINQGQHVLDFWQWLFGMPDRLFAKIPFGKYQDFSVDDEATLVMEYPDKVTGTFFLTTAEIPGEEKLEVVGTKGRAVLTEESLRIWRYADIKEYIKTAPVDTGTDLQVSCEEIRLEPLGNLRLELLENFAAHLLQREPLIAPGCEGENALWLSNAAYLSAWTGSEVVLPFDAAAFDRELARRVEMEGKDRRVENAEMEVKNS